MRYTSQNRPNENEVYEQQTRSVNKQERERNESHH